MQAVFIELPVLEFSKKKMTVQFPTRSYKVQVTWKKTWTGKFRKLEGLKGSFLKEGIENRDLDSAGERPFTQLNGCRLSPRFNWREDW